MLPEEVERFQGWRITEWKEYIATRARECPTDTSVEAATKTSEQISVDDLDPNVLASVHALLPPQPWPNGVEEGIAEKLGISHEVVSLYISELVRRGIFMHQAEEQPFPAGETG